MHHYARGFVDNDQIVVFVHDRQRDVLGQHLAFNRILENDLEDFAFGHVGFGIGYHNTITRDCTLGQQFGDP